MKWINRAVGRFLYNLQQKDNRTSVGLWIATIAMFIFNYKFVWVDRLATNMLEGRTPGMQKMLLILYPEWQPTLVQRIFGGASWLFYSSCSVFFFALLLVSVFNTPYAWSDDISIGFRNLFRTIRQRREGIATTAGAAPRQSFLDSIQGHAKGFGALLTVLFVVAYDAFAEWLERRRARQRAAKS